MSIEICYKCSHHVDTDYDTDTIVYQKDAAYCRSCAVPQCFFVEIRDKEVDYINTWKGHFIKAYSHDDCIDMIHEEFGYVGFNDVRIRHDGTWESFEKDPKN